MRARGRIMVSALVALTMLTSVPTAHAEPVPPPPPPPIPGAWWCDDCRDGAGAWVLYPNPYDHVYQRGHVN